MRPIYLTPVALLLTSVFSAYAQQPDGPQASPPPPVAPAPQTADAPVGSGAPVTVPAGTRFAVVLENGISTRSAKVGDSLYLRTSFPVTEHNRIIVPVGSYLRGELIETKRPGRIKGKGEFRMRLNTLIFPNGYTVDLTAVPRSADSGGKETMDSEGKTTGPGGKDHGDAADAADQARIVGLFLVRVLIIGGCLRQLLLCISISLLSRGLAGRGGCGRRA